MSTSSWENVSPKKMKSYWLKHNRIVFVFVISVLFKNRWKALIAKEVRPEKHKVSGAILSDQVKSLDWQMRNAKRMACAPKDVIEDVLAKMLTILGCESR